MRHGQEGGEQDRADDYRDYEILCIPSEHELEVERRYENAREAAVPLSGGAKGDA